MSFENFHLTSLFKEIDENSRSGEICSATRNSLVRLHTEGLQKLSNTSTNLLLEQRISEYSNVYNNNSKEFLLDPIDSLLKGKIQTRHCASWKSQLSLTNLDVSKLVKKPENIGKHCDLNKNLPCQSDLISKANIALILEVKKQRNEETQLSKDDVKTMPNNIPKPTQPTWNSLNLPQVNTSTENMIDHVNKRASKECTTFFNKPNNNVAKLFQHPQSSNLRKPTNYNAYNQSNNISKPNLSENAAPREQYCNTNKQPNDESVPQNQYTFRTARSELVLQNKKKYGNANPSHQQVPESNYVKRSLGTTRSSVQNKFIPPMSTGSEQAPMECEEVEDERLKHIDPKMVELIKSEIIDSSAPIGWDDIAGLDFAKSAIQEAVVWPLLRPDIFTGLRRPPKGILLFGPPGTGKTLIGKCIASSCCATFFSISASSLTSKWIGDGEKMVRALFAVARCYQPAVVFIDEIDSLLTQRSDAEHEATRRIKTEFLVQLDGAATGDEDRLLVIGATNRPQELDEAARRRLVKRLYIPLPDIKARQQIVQRLMGTERHSLTEEDIARVALLADGFSGADMRSLCSEAALGPIRAVPLSQITNIQCDQVRPVNVDDFKNALSRVRPSVSSNDLEHYIVWDKTYGSGSNHL